MGERGRMLTLNDEPDLLERDRVTIFELWDLHGQRDHASAWSNSNHTPL